MKKILGVVGSPRKKGNTHILVSRIFEGAKKEGAKGEILFLNVLDIQEILGKEDRLKEAFDLGRTLAK